MAPTLGFSSRPREIEACGATLLGVEHGDVVRLRLVLPEVSALALRQRLNESGQGRLFWLEQDS